MDGRSWERRGGERTERRGGEKGASWGRGGEALAHREGGAGDRFGRRESSCKLGVWEGGGGMESVVTFMGFWILVEEEERHSVLKEGVAQQLEALIGDILLARLGSQGLQHIHYMGLPAQCPHTHILAGSTNGEGE